jgi:hypothetical protein
MYAELCLKVQPACPEFEDNGKKQNFRRLLLNRCQKEFEKKVPPAPSSRCLLVAQRGNLSRS